MNKGIQELLNTPKPLPPLKEGEFRLSEAKDPAGVPLEHPSYVKKKCIDCYGRGHQTVIERSAPVGTVGDLVEKKKLRTCVCVHRSYASTRVVFERAVKKMVKEGKTIDQAAAEAITALFD